MGSRVQRDTQESPQGIVDFVVENAETFAQKKGYIGVSRKSLDEQMKEMGMDLDDML